MKVVIHLAFLISMLFISTVNSQMLTSFEKFSEMEKAIVKENDTLYVVNFWATWCGPCVKELPHFETFTQQTKGQKIKVILVSLDFKNQVETQLKPFLRKKNYTSEVVYLADKDYNTWLSKVDTDWSGSIPATWLIKGTRRLFKESDFENADELHQFVNSFNNQ